MSDARTTEAAPKRGRGRPPGAYGKYRPRLPEELKEPELNSLAQELNRELKEPEFIDELSRKNSDRRNGVGKTGFLKNARWEAFARNIAKAMSGTKAYLSAGYEGDERAAQSSASDLLSRPIVANRVEQLKAAAAKAALITPARVLEATGRIAFAKVAPNPDDLSSLTREQIGTLSIQRAALGDLGGYLGMKKEKVEHSGPDGQPIQIQVQALLGLVENPTVMERLTDEQVQAIRAAALALAAPAAPVIDAVAETVATTAGGCAAEAAGASGEEDGGEDTPES